VKLSERLISLATSAWNVLFVLLGGLRRLVCERASGLWARRPRQIEVALAMLLRIGVFLEPAAIAVLRPIVRGGLLLCRWLDSRLELRAKVFPTLRKGMRVIGRVFYILLRTAYLGTKVPFRIGIWLARPFFRMTRWCGLLLFRFARPVLLPLFVLIRVILRLVWISVRPMLIGVRWTSRRLLFVALPAIAMARRIVVILLRVVFWLIRHPVYVPVRFAVVTALGLAGSAFLPIWVLLRVLLRGLRWLLRPLARPALRASQFILHPVCYALSACVRIVLMIGRPPLRLVSRVLLFLLLILGRTAAAVLLPVRVALFFAFRVLWRGFRAVGRVIAAAVRVGVVRPTVAVAETIVAFIYQLPSAPSGFVPAFKHYVWVVRSLLAPSWRVCARWTTVGLGLAIFCAMQYGIAIAVDQMMISVIVGAYVAIVCFVLAATKPTLAFIIWLFLSPFAFVLLRIDFGEGLPAISFDRVVIIALAFLLVARTIIDRVRIRRYIFGEICAIGFVGFATLMFMLTQHQNLTQAMSDRFDHIALGLMIYFVAKASIRHSEHIGWALVAMVLAGVYCSAFGYYEHFTGNSWFSNFVGEEIRLSADIAKGRAAGPLLNPSPYGTFLSICIFLCFHLSNWTKSLAKKSMYYALAAFMSVGVFFSYTRGGYLPLIFMVLAAPFLVRAGRRQFVAIAVGAVLLAIVVVPVLMKDPQFYFRMTGKANVNARIILAASMWKAFGKNYLLGVGMGHAEEAMEKNLTSVGTLSALHGRYYEPGRTGLVHLPSSHNSFLTIMLEQGIFGFGLYLGSIIGFLGHAWRCRRSLGKTGVVSGDLASLVILCALGHYLSISTYDVRVFKFPTYVVWLLYAFVVRARELQEDRELVVTQMSKEPAPVGFAPRRNQHKWVPMEGA